MPEVHEQISAKGCPKNLSWVLFDWYIHKWSVLVYSKLQLSVITIKIMKIGFHFRSRLYLIRYLTCNWFAIMPLSGSLSTAWELIQKNSNSCSYLIFLSSSLAYIELVLDANTCITSKDCVKVLGITINKQMTFNEHISLCSTNAARQLNPFARLSKYLNQSTRRAIHHRFIANNFSYCRLIWHSVASRTMQN